MSPMTQNALMVLMLAIAAVTVEGAAKPQCRTFREIYGNEDGIPGGKKVCENMWGGAFKYETEEDKAFVMFFTDNVNPNEGTANSLNAADASLYDGKGHEDATKNGNYDTDQCHLDYFHKDTPSKEDQLSLCPAYQKKEACCAPNTVKDSATVMGGYGKEFHWDRCGTLSPQCEAFFIHEACFYECEPAAGLYRKHPKHVFDTQDNAGGTDSEPEVLIGNASDANTWQMEGMPIKASYCDAWYAACADDKFCASDEGDFFSCALEYKAVDDSSKGLKPGIVAAIVVPVLVATGACFFMIFMVRKERAGQPMFEPIDREDARGGAQA